MLLQSARDFIVSIQTLLTADLKLSSTCQTAVDKLLGILADDTVFAKELTQHFSRGKRGIPYAISPNDPAQVAVLKKVINAFAHAQTAFKDLESVNVSDERYLMKIASDYAANGYGAVHELYAAIQLINQSSADVQTIVGPYLQELLPKLDVLTQKLPGFNPTEAGNIAAQAVGSAVGMLPTERQTGTESLGQISQFIFSLPEYFASLQAQIQSGTTVVSKKDTTAEAYKEAMTKRAQQTTKYFERLANNNGTILGLPAYFATLSSLAKHGSDLVGTAAPLTATAYQAAVERLNKIRHELLPNLIVELEEIEESMALRPGTLVDPTMKHMQTYYKQLADYVTGIATAAGALDSVATIANTNYGAIALKLLGSKKIGNAEKVTPVIDLDVLGDEHFETYISKQRTARIVEAQIESQDTSKKVAATQFFDQIASLSPFSHRWRLGSATPEVKQQLLSNYKQFQDHFAALHPEEDKMIVAALGGQDVRHAAGYTRTALNVLFSNEFKTILDCKASVMESIQQSQAQSAFRAKLIQEGAKHQTTNSYNSKDKKTQLTVDVSAFKPISFTVEEELELADEAGVAAEDQEPEVAQVIARPLSEKYKQKQLAVAVQLFNLNDAKTAVHTFLEHLEQQRLASIIGQLNEDEQSILFNVGSFSLEDDVVDASMVAELKELVVIKILELNKPETTQEDQLEQLTTNFMYFAKEPELTSLKRVCSKIHQLAAHYNPVIATMSDEEKEPLRYSYKVFQPYTIVDSEAAAGNELVAEEDEDAQQQVQIVSLNEQLVDSLMSNKDNQLRVNDVLPMLVSVNLKLEQLIGDSEREEIGYTTQLTREKAKELEEKVFKSMGDELEKKTLFGQLRTLKLSEKLESFIKSNALPGKLPYVEFYKDSPDVQMRKKLINALYGLKTTLATLESLDGSDPGNILTRALYLRHFLYIVLDLVAIKAALTDAAKNPALTAFIGEGSKLLAPLQRIPIIGDYIKTTFEPAPTNEQDVVAVRDVVAEWEFQQGIVGRMRTGRPLSEQAPAEEADEQDEDDDVVEVEPVEEEQQLLQTIIHKIADHIYSIPQQIRGLRVDIALPDEQVATQEAAILAKKAEFIQRLSNLSYGPGTVGSILVAIQESITQLTEIGAETRALMLAKLTELPRIVGGSLISLADTAEFNLGYATLGMLSSGLETQFNQFYSSLVDSFPAADFNEEAKAQHIFNGRVALIKVRIQEEQARLERLEQTKDTIEANARREIFGQFNVISEGHKAGYSTRDLQITFLREYEKLQPVLVKIDDSFDVSGFVRTLRNPEDFSRAAQKISNMSRKLELYITQGILGTRNNEIARCRDRIKALTAHLGMVTAEAEFTCKQRIANEHLEAIRKRYGDSLGPYANLFFTKIENEFLVKRQGIFANTENPIEVEILILQNNILNTNLELFAAYQALNEVLSTLQGIIASEEGVVTNNPCRATKIAQLKAEEARLKADNLLSHESTKDQVQAEVTATKESLTKLNKDHNKLIKAFDMLEEMKTYVSTQPDNDEKSRKINEMQDILKDETKQSTTRISEVAELGNSNECKEILLKNADNILLRLLKSFWTLITGWQSEDEKKVTRFGSQLNAVKNESDEVDYDNDSGAFSP